MMFSMEKRTARERRHERTRDEILSAALALIVEKGTDNLSMRELARRVDYSPAGLYEYFGSKDKIITALCIEANSRLAAYLRAVSTEKALRDYLVELGLAYVRFARQNQEHFMLLFSSRVPDMESIPDDIDVTHPEDGYSILLRTVKTGIANGVIASTEGYGAAEISYSMWAFVHGMATLQVTYLRNLALDFEVADRRALEAFVASLVEDH